MTVAEERGRQSPEAAEAVGYVQKLWSYFIEDLVDPDNELAETAQGRPDLDRLVGNHGGGSRPQ